MKAIVSDIHANIAAWEAVKKDIKSHNITDIISLGDLVGYGPEPIDVIDEAMDFRVNLMGNHDEAVVFEPVGFNYRALTAIRWTIGTGATIPVSQLRSVFNPAGSVPTSSSPTRSDGLSTQFIY